MNINKMGKIWASGLVIATLAACATAPAKAADPKKTNLRATWTVKAKFADVREQIMAAIQNKGLKINNISYIGKMLIRTGKDLGFKKQVYTEAQAFEFCSATVSRAMMEADPHNIIFCPYIIVVYELADKPGTVYISYRRPIMHGSEASKKSLIAVEALLDAMIKDAVSWF